MCQVGVMWTAHMGVAHLFWKVQKLFPDIFEKGDQRAILLKVLEVIWPFASFR